MIINSIQRLTCALILSLDVIMKDAVLQTFTEIEYH